jgi:hypothetical protein
MEERGKGKRETGEGKEETGEGKEETGNRRQDTGNGIRKKETANGKQLNRQTIHLNAPPPQNCIGATTIRLNAKKVIDKEAFNF